jgi:hypothetical protein
LEIAQLTSNSPQNTQRDVDLGTPLLILAMHRSNVDERNTALVDSKLGEHPLLRMGWIIPIFSMHYAFGTRVANRSLFFGTNTPTRAQAHSCSSLQGIVDLCVSRGSPEARVR